MRQILFVLFSLLSTGFANQIDTLRPIHPNDPNVAVNITARSEINGGCTGANGAPGVCIHTSACTKDGGHYISDACPDTPDDVKCCTKTSCSSGGNCRWTSQCSGSTATGFCPGPNNFKCCLSGGGGGSSGGGSDTSSINSPITRSQIMSRGQYWIDKQVEYSQEKTYPDSSGTRYRTDCSGFVSMALHTNHPGYSTVSLPEIAVRIEWDQLKEGDFVGTLGEGTGKDDGHVVLFHSWADSSKKRIKTLECTGHKGCIAYERARDFSVGSRSALPYRYKRVK